MLGTLASTHQAAEVASLGQEPVVQRSAFGEACLTWDPITHPSVWIRDPATGQALGHGAGGTMTIATSARELEVAFCDNIRSLTKTLMVPDES